MPANRNTRLPHSLRSYSSHPDSVPSYRRIAQDAIDGKFPTFQVNGIWHHNDADLPVIAAFYGLPAKAGAQRELVAA